MGKTRFVTAVVFVLAAFGLLGAAPVLGEDLPSLKGADGWINSAPLTRSALSGKVVLVDFWEYTCVNCVRTFPVLKKWYREFGSKGLVIIGVHTPEFTFGQKRANVEGAVSRFGLAYPVALDNRMVLWDRFRNHYWPAEYLFDRTGRLIYHSIGEGDYDAMERRIRGALALSGSGAAPTAEGPGFNPDMTMELYAGSERGILPEPSEKRRAGEGVDVLYSGGALVPDRFNPRGSWTVYGEYLLPRPVPGRVLPVLILPYHASGVHLVLRPDGPGVSKMRVTLDGKAVPKEFAGPDIRYDRKGRSYLAVRAARMYDLTSHQPFGAHTLGLEPVGTGPAIYSATFDPE